VAVILEGDHPQRCVAFNQCASHELFFVAETNAEPPPRLPPHAHMVPPFTVQLWMWMVPLGHDFMNGGKVRPSQAAFHIERSVMYSDAGFDVSKCGRFLALCELDTATASGYHLKTVSLQPRSLGQVLQTVALPNCPYVTSVQFSPLVASVLIGYGRCQQPPPNATNEPPTYAVLRCVAFRGDSKQEAAATDDVELFAIDSTDESNVALFHPHASAAGHLSFLYATKDGRIRCFRYDPAQRQRNLEAAAAERQPADGALLAR